MVTEQKPSSWGSRVRVAMIALVITGFFSVPALLLIYGAIAAVIAGVSLIGTFTLVQIPIFLLLKRLNVLPTETLGLPTTPEDELIDE